MHGVVILDVPQNSAAASQGLRAGDLVVAVGGAAVGAPNDALVNRVAGGEKGRAQERADPLSSVSRATTRFVTMPIETA